MDTQGERLTVERLLVVNADDFGLSSGVNEGILEAHTNGIVTSTSLMLSGNAVDEAAQAAKGHPQLSLGLHFIEEEAVDLDDPVQAADSFNRQLERFRELTGSEPTHIDSHHHVHAEENRMPIFAELVGPLGVPLRGDGRVRYIGGFYGQWEYGVTNLECLSRTFLLELVRTEALEGFSELACHPARLTGDFTSAYLAERAVELATLTEPGLRDDLEVLGVKVVSYHDWGGTRKRLAVPGPEPSHPDR